MSDNTPPGPPEPPEPASPEPPVEPDQRVDLESTAELAEFFHTEDLPPRAERRSHRGAVEGAPFMERLFAPATAVVVVIVVVLLLIWINGSSSGNGPSAAAIGPGAHHTRSAQSPTPTSPSGPPVPTATPARTTVPAPAPTSARRASPGTAKSVQPRSTKSSTRSRPAASTARAPVSVLNNSRRTGLAATVAAQLEAKHWTVSSVGNQQTVIPETTLYYPPGDHAAAVHLSHDFPSIQRIASRAGGRGMTLVLTASWVL